MESQLENRNTKAKSSAVGSLSFSTTASAMVLLLLGAAAEHEGYSAYLFIVSATAIAAIWGQFFSTRRSTLDSNA